MRRTAQFLFLLFYIASSYATCQELTTVVASQVRHFSGPAGRSSSFETGVKYFGSDPPNFKQAKPRTICALEIALNLKFVFLPHVRESVWPVQIHSLKSLHSIQRALDRAPPSQS
jgi:hypothetical protein